MLAVAGIFGFAVLTGADVAVQLAKPIITKPNTELSDIFMGSALYVQRARGDFGAGIRFLR